MAFDQATRNRLQSFVSKARTVLEEEFSQQMTQTYGLDPSTGKAADLSALTHLSDAQRETARILRETQLHYVASQSVDERGALDRILREQAFTVLNRLAALRMAEARGLLIDTISEGYDSRGFQLYKTLAGAGLGETGDAYRVYLFSVFDEFAQELPGLFDRYSPQGRLFPREVKLLELLGQINDTEIAHLWGEDETIGWIYQYFNSQEERKRMRAESQAPRNSRELAVRNQFFTPRYVVEFLVDNTLGKMWFNATGGQTFLKDRCQYLLVKPDESPEPARQLRDPRTLKLLDPACGSMHFGLYAFDLFLEIYREAWAHEQQLGAGSLDTKTQGLKNFQPLMHTYASEEAYLLDVPRLVIEHNIYGVDIDPRAAQIASLALWLRAQRAWHEAGIKARQRPLIGRGNVVAAIAPPGEKQVKEEFVQDLDPKEVELFEKTLTLLKGLPELGVLLRVERELPNLIQQVYGKQVNLYAEKTIKTWQQVEQDLRMALTSYAQEANSSYQGRLFAQDALEGLRLIDLTRETFDVVVMNPPFGAPTTNTYDYIASNYKGSHNDIYCAFINRACEVSPNGFVGCISSRSFLMSARAEAFRAEIVLNKLTILADLGLGIMDDAYVESAAYIMNNNPDSEFLIINLLESKNKEEDLRISIIENKYKIHLRDWYSGMPKRRIMYHAPEEVRSIFNNTPSFEPIAGTSRGGMNSFDNFRFVRTWWEVQNTEIGSLKAWRRFNKGGEFSLYYIDLNLVLNWKNEGAELCEINLQVNGSTAQVRQASTYWYKTAATYSRRSARGFSARLLPQDYIFTSNGPSVLSTSKVSTIYILGWLNTKLITSFIEMQSNFGDYSSGSIKKLPWIDPDEVTEKLVCAYTQEAYLAGLKFNMFSNETSTWFYGIVIKDSFNQSLDFANNLLLNYRKKTQESIESSTNIIMKLYNISNLDWTQDLSEDDHNFTSLSINPEEYSGISPEEFCERIASYIFGLVFHRFSSIKTITFDIINDITAPPPQNQPASYSNLSINCESILDIDTKYDGSLIKNLRLVLTKLMGNNLPEWEQDLSKYLKVSRIEDYFLRTERIFSYHLSKYSEGGRQAPIYWPLSTTSGSYTLWIYYPALTNQTLYSAVNDFVEPKLKQVQGDITALKEQGGNRSKTEEKQYENLLTLEKELLEFRDVLLGIAEKYQPNHDDGVQISAAPLWQLFRHKPWQKVLKDTWTKLEKGDYDWAYLAMAYWPDRVRAKCQNDKSLAIAHNLEPLYTEPAAKGKKGQKTGENP